MLSKRRKISVRRELTWGLTWGPALVAEREVKGVVEEAGATRGPNWRRDAPMRRRGEQRVSSWLRRWDAVKEVDRLIEEHQEEEEEVHCFKPPWINRQQQPVATGVGMVGERLLGWRMCTRTITTAR